MCPSRPLGCDKRKCFFLIFTQPEGLLSEVNVHRMKSNIKLAKSKLSNNESFKNGGSFSNPRLWALEMGFYSPAWVGSFVAEACLKEELKGSDASVHLNVLYRESDVSGSSESDITSSLDSRDSTSAPLDSPDTPTFSFVNREIIKPQRVLREPLVTITFNNPIRGRNESYDYDSDELTDKNSSRRLHGRKSDSAVEPSRSSSSSSGSGNTSTSSFSSSSSSSSNSLYKNILSSRRSFMRIPSFQGNSPLDDSHGHGHSHHHSETDSSHRNDAQSNSPSTSPTPISTPTSTPSPTTAPTPVRRKTMSTLEERPPFYPPYSQGIPSLYGVNPMVRKSPLQSPQRNSMVEIIKIKTGILKSEGDKSSRRSGRSIRFSFDDMDSNLTDGDRDGDGDTNTVLPEVLVSNTPSTSTSPSSSLSTSTSSSTSPSSSPSPSPSLLIHMCQYMNESDSVHRWGFGVGNECVRLRVCMFIFAHVYVFTCERDSVCFRANSSAQLYSLASSHYHTLFGTCISNVC